MYMKNELIISNTMKPHELLGSKMMNKICVLSLLSLLLQNGEELGMEKDRLMLLDATAVPASLIQLREVTYFKGTQVITRKTAAMKFKMHFTTCVCMYK